MIDAYLEVGKSMTGKFLHVSAVAFRLLVIGTAMAAIAPAARAATLLNLVDAPGTTGTSYALQLIATDATTTIAFGGYQLQGNEEVSQVELSLAGNSTNLAGGNYTFTPAAYGSFTSVVGGNLFFGGYVPGNYDTYSQNIGTVSGALYTLDFTYTNPLAPSNAPSALLVTTTGTLVPVPEPASLSVLAIGLLGLSTVARRRRG